jgi:hypothetical protein
MELATFNELLAPTETGFLASFEKLRERHARALAKVALFTGIEPLA